MVQCGSKEGRREGVSVFHFTLFICSDGVGGGGGRVEPLSALADAEQSAYGGTGNGIHCQRHYQRLKIMLKQATYSHVGVGGGC